MHRISLIAVYFGKLPSYFSLWKMTAGKNPSIDFFLISDASDHDIGPLPDNIKFYRMTLNAFRNKAESQLGMKIALEHPYKICDFRPAFAKIFEAELRDYGFWGYCDLDIIWGDLRAAYPEILFDQYDRIQENGHLTFLRNSDVIRNLYLMSGQFNRANHVFTDPRSHAFDEYGGFHTLFYQSGLKRFRSINFADMSSIHFQLWGNAIRNYKKQIFYWEDGKVIREHIPDRKPHDWHEGIAFDKTEFSYIHLQKRAMEKPDFDPNLERGFYITPNSFIPKRALDHSFVDFAKFNPKAPFRRPYFGRRMKSRIREGLDLVERAKMQFKTNFV